MSQPISEKTANTTVSLYSSLIHNYSAANTYAEILNRDTDYTECGSYVKLSSESQNACGDDSLPGSMQPENNLYTDIQFCTTPLYAETQSSRSTYVDIHPLDTSTYIDVYLPNSKTEEVALLSHTLPNVVTDIGDTLSTASIRCDAVIDYVDLPLRDTTDGYSRDSKFFYAQLDETVS